MRDDGTAGLVLDWLLFAALFGAGFAIGFWGF